MAACDLKELQESLKAAFDKIDTDSDGRVSHKDLKALLQDAGFNGNADNIKAIIAKADANADGWLSFNEFSAAVVAVGVAVRVMMYLRKTFAELDTDGSGFIDPADIRKLVKDADIKDVTDKDIDELIAEVDTSGDGKVSFEEFATAIGKRLEESQG